MITAMTEDKKQLADIYRRFVEEVRINVQRFGDKIKTFSNTFAQNYCNIESKMMSTTDSAVQKISPIDMEFRLVSSYLEQEESKYLNEGVTIIKHPFIPSVIVDNKNILETHYPHIWIFLLHL
jgi:DUF4097 and DUF4098 domain-containing protein YvlB